VVTFCVKVFWVVTLCSIVVGYQCVRGPCCLPQPRRPWLERLYRVLKLRSTKYTFVLVHIMLCLVRDHFIKKSLLEIRVGNQGFMIEILIC
jgi:hypothetical protein